LLATGGGVDAFLTLPLNTPTYTAAYHAAIDGLMRLAEMMGYRPRAASSP